MIETMLSVLFVLACLYLWQNALKARDLARALGHDLCARASVQLLDQSVSLAGLSFTRNAQGHLRLRRRYAFEVSLDGHDRHRGALTLLDGRILSWSLPVTQAAATVADQSNADPSNVIPLPRPDPPRRLH